MSRAASRECSACHLGVPATAKSPAVHLSSGYFHMACFERRFINPNSEPFVPSPDDEAEIDFLESAPEIENEETPVIREILVALPKSITRKRLLSVVTPVEDVRSDVPSRWLLVELRDGARTGWTHPYASKESAEKKAYWMNQNAGALSYLVEPDFNPDPLPVRSSLLPSELRKI